MSVTMTERDQPHSGGKAGRIVVSIAAVLTLALPFADWGANHNFSPTWSNHARYHASASDFTLAATGALALWLLWRRAASSADRALGVDAAALLLILAWVTFFPALLVPGIAVLEVGEEAAYVAGIPSNLILFGGLTVIAAVGWIIHRRGQPARRGPSGGGA